ncbi:kinesin KIF27, partial [Brachionus plicatilis]
MASNLSNQNYQMTSEVAVKVAVRVRPLNSREKLHQHQPCVRLSSETNQLVIGKDKVFTFDYVLAPKTSQSDLYQSCVHQLVQSIFDGYNSTVFAYGQTGSGKTHTISGSSDDYGIIPRAVEAMFQTINSKQESQRDYLVKVNFIEIYKEELKDLLDSSEKDLHIREDESGNTIIYGANEVVCSSLEQVMACFESGTLLRHTGTTQMNEQSSRSHSVFTVSIEQRWTDDNVKVTSVRDSSVYELKQMAMAAAATQPKNTCYLGAKFHFVDLAGSERVHRTGNVGDRFKESIHINSGLLALGNVISALSSADNSAKKKSVHIPYRDSKITRILKDSLGGNSNTLMICCISPSSCNLDESINALKYATRARYIKNKPIVNMDPEQQKFVEMQSEIQALREELSRQRTFISEANLATTTNDQDLIAIQQKLEQTQNEADVYKKLVKEAYNRFKQFDQLLACQNSSAMITKLTDEWLQIFEA